MLKIDNFKIERVNGLQQISADVGGEQIWFQMPHEVPLLLSAEPFIAAALLEAMYTGQDIEVDCSVAVSRQLAENLTDLQAVFHCWNDELKIVGIHASLLGEGKKFGRVGSFYSAGVDSSFTLCRKMSEITHLMLMDVFDGQALGYEWESLVERQSQFVDALGKRLIPIRSNVRNYAEGKKISWDFMHGLIISSIGSFFGFDRVYVPSSHTYRELFPWGSHPLTDPMWSTESMRVIHEGAGARRWEKVKSLTQHQRMLDNLHVCWRTKIGNCGECPKCIRTMLALHLLGARSKAIPEYTHATELHQLKTMDDHGAVYLVDAMVAAKATGNHTIYRKLYWYHKQYQLLGILEHIDRGILGGVVRKLYRTIKKPDWLDSRVALGAKN